jgi:Protein of unknown function (DUF2384)
VARQTTAIVSQPEEASLSHSGGTRRCASACRDSGYALSSTLPRNGDLSVEHQRLLLGGVAPSTYYKWKSGTIGTLSFDQLERVSLVLGIYKALKLLFADDASAERWLKAANTDLPFAGNSPLDRMLRGSIDDLYAVRRYLDGWRGGWP